MIPAAAAGNPDLREIIAVRIAEAGGSIGFDEFMSLALYHPRHGYYLTCDPTLDFQTSPQVHAVFGATLARQLAGFWREMGRPPRFDVLEAAAGNGRLATGILLAARLEEPGFAEALRYTLQDVTYVDSGPPQTVQDLLRDRVGWRADMPPAGSIEGCILSNELLDALPVQRLRRRDGKLLEVRVGMRDDAFVDVERPASEELEAHFADLGLTPGEGCEAEVCLRAPRWYAEAASALGRGFLLTLDYGYEAAELYAPWRKAGTLLTFYRHTSGADPYARVGYQDITAGVDFTTVRRAGEAAGLSTLLFTSQSEYLTALGIGEALAAGPPGGNLEAFYALRRAVIELTDPASLGRIRVLLQSRL